MEFIRYLVLGLPLETELYPSVVNDTGLPSKFLLLLSLMDKRADNTITDPSPLYDSIKKRITLTIITLTSY